MNNTALNYRHLHYFWVVAREGSMTRAAERLDVAVQTISSQIALLERDLGKALLAPQGRGITLTDAGRQVLAYADQIFELGEQLQESLRAPSGPERPRLVVGISDGLPKLVAYRLLAAILTPERPVQLVCNEGEFEDLLADLALHRLDVVLTDRPAPSSGNLRVFSHSLGGLEVGLFGTRELAQRFAPGFPASLADAPLLLPTRHNVLRGHIDRWLEASRIRPQIVGEFEDSALLHTFGRASLGLFPAPRALADEVATQFQAIPVGPMTGVAEQIFAISNERRIKHPLVEALCAAPLSPNDSTSRP